MAGHPLHLEAGELEFYENSVELVEIRTAATEGSSNSSITNFERRNKSGMY